MVAQNSPIVNITDAEFEKIVSFVYRTYGIDLRKKRQLIEGRLSQTLKAKGFLSFDQYFNMLLNDMESIGHKSTFFPCDYIMTFCDFQ